MIAVAYISHPEGKEVAAAQLAVYSQVEEREFYDSPFHL
jgi:hypothetical protein